MSARADLPAGLLPILPVQLALMEQYLHARPSSPAQASMDTSSKERQEATKRLGELEDELEAEKAKVRQSLAPKHRGAGLAG